METNAPLAALRNAHLAELGRRFAAILPAHDLDAVVLHAGSLALRRRWDDQHWPFLPAAPYAQWIDLPHPECLIVVRPGEQPHLVRVVEESFWERPPAVADEQLAGFRVTIVDGAERSVDHLPTGRVAFIGRPGARAARGFPSEQVNPPSLLRALDRQRDDKTPYEVRCIAEANRRAAPAHRAVAESFASQGLSELQLHLSYLAVSRQDDAETPYKNIVALGANAATLHHVSYRKDSGGDGDESLLLDAGATFGGYASDVTRTHARGGGAAAEVFRALVGEIDQLQQRLCARVEPGLPYESLHDQAHVELAGVLQRSGICKLSVDEQVASGLTRAFLPHGLGHALGLQVHDVGCAEIAPRPENRFLRNTTKIAVGQVFTVEPGLYFIRALLEPLAARPALAIDWELVGRLAPFGGIRIEDDLAVTPAGVLNLTRDAFSR